MKLEICPDIETVSQIAAERLATMIRAKPDLGIVVATGNTPMPVYAELVRMQARGEVDCRNLRVFQLDAYLGINDDDPRSLFGWMMRSFITPLGIAPENVVRFAALPPDPPAECLSYAAKVRAMGGYDVAVLGLGPNGHLGFNEPPSADDAPTRVVALTEQSVASNGHYWGGPDAVPRQSMTAGMDLLLSARAILLVVTGSRKQIILNQTLHGPVTPQVPASYLQTRPQALILADADAAGGKTA